MTLAIHSLRKIIPHIRYFDVSMRDGLQSLSKIYTLPEKQIMLDTIMKTHKPHALEIGSLVSPKILPQMANSYELYQYANTIYNKNSIYNKFSRSNMINYIYHPCDFYLLVPPTKKYLDRAQNLNIKNISLITSVSEAFQRKNINQSIQETKENIKNVLKNPGTFDNVKLYVSCITHCPISGKQDNHHILNELYEYLEIDGINEICISDTCGNMKQKDFIDIIDNLSKKIKNMKNMNMKMNMNTKMDKLSLHLHMNENDNDSIDSKDSKDSNEFIDNSNIDTIIEYALINNIHKFDVSSLKNSGGCSITITDRTKLNGNLTYDRLNENIYDYYM
jgi:hypothetical protein